MTDWFIAHTAWFVYTAKTHFLWVILPPKHMRSALADLLLIRMMKTPSLHYNHKPSRSFQQVLRKHSRTNLTPHIPRHAENSVHVPPFSNTESILIHSWKNTIPITEAFHSRPADTEPWQQATGWSQWQAQTKQTPVHATAHTQDLFLTSQSLGSEGIDVCPKRWNTITYGIILCSEVM